MKSLACEVEECLTKDLLDSCRYARQRYSASLATKKKEAEISEKENLKRKAEEELRQCKKTQKLEALAESLVKEVDQLASDAERKNNLALLV